MATMRQLILATTLGLSALGASTQAEPVKVPVDSDEKGSVYVAPNVNPTETSATVKGGTVGVLRPDGSGTHRHRHLHATAYFSLGEHRRQSARSRAGCRRTARTTTA